MEKRIHLVCPHCDSTNRIPLHGLAGKPKCGRCHKPLFNTQSISLTTDKFQKHMRNNDIPLLVEFWAPWCGFCQKMATSFEQAAAILQPQVRLIKVNSDQEPILSRQHSVQGLPTVILFKGGKEVARQSGVMSAEQIVNWTRAHL